MPDIRHAIQIAASAESIFPIIATASGWTQWWAEDVRESRGVIELGFFNRTTIYRLKPLTQKPPQCSEWLCESGKEWSGTRLLFELTTAGTATNLHFTHSNWEAESEYFTNCNTTWGELMFRIKSTAEGDPRGPLFLASGLAY